MQLALQNLVPVPLRDKILQRSSDIWNTDVLLQQGQRIKVKAPSGTGKTTLIHILYRLRDDYKGAVLWDNKDERAYDATAMAVLRQQQVSVVFQDLRLFTNLTARENIELNRVLTPTPLYDASVIDAMAERLGITHILQQRAGLCSYGEQQRIAIVRALVQPFNWLLMDEPFSHLDANNTRKAAALIAEECEKRKAGFVLTDLDEDAHFDYNVFYNL
ncbi:putative ABC transport system ATP-binding protein [Filimonas lacunae]|uniref:Putative ABC transport system ATP-binding protein n=1 Tax=Filimonas lacunae TaxID=477680 RepID=A0A173MRN9_9BACT|nr:ATP-binding cassette domain-containing protein [Filimonas lacunae]BAV10099.1 ABC transporter ATP-binding protein [Filimonas lacunae]SIS83982.1 putative ABC transport system ATP-binding protein [Filimonas lacunae]